MACKQYQEKNKLLIWLILSKSFHINTYKRKIVHEIIKNTLHTIPILNGLLL